MKVGIEGECHPQVRYDFKPVNVKRLGDYRQWLPDYIPQQESLEDWGVDYELWRNDLRDFNFGLMSDKLERAVREVYNKNLLVDAGSARLVLVVPSLLPHPVLDTLLQTLFERWSFPSIALLPMPVTALVAAGIRSGLLVDIGWEETVVTAVYEYREVRSHRTTRAVKSLTRNFATWVMEFLPQQHRFTLEVVEDVLKQLMLHVLSIDTQDSNHTEQMDNVILDWPTTEFTSTVNLSAKELSTMVRETILGRINEYPDDEELPIQQAMYNALLLLPIDIRGVCLSRIVFTGEGAEVYGLKLIVMEAFEKLLASRGWNEVQGKMRSRTRQESPALAQYRAQPADVKHDDLIWSEKVVTEERYLREKLKQTQPTVHGVVRQIETLGSWAGASLLTTLKTKSFVEVQREKFLSRGLAGASKDLDLSVIPQNRISTMGNRSKAAERTSWTLSGWG